MDRATRIEGILRNHVFWHGAGHCSCGFGRDRTIARSAELHAKHVAGLIANGVCCYACGDGVEYVGGTWDHVSDSIDVDGHRVMSPCDWGKPWA